MEQHRYRHAILPVFAGMVPFRVTQHLTLVNSPRIRGDGPPSRSLNRGMTSFSPYSRGWSRFNVRSETGLGIFPVFAGMVPWFASISGRIGDFPRIRGDGPKKKSTVKFWNDIFPVFAGMVPTSWRGTW